MCRVHFLHAECMLLQGKMKLIWLLVFVYIEMVCGQRYNASCATLRTECGIPRVHRRIVGGSAVQPHEYPWLVALMLGPKLHCAGAVITDLHVLTAGHCITFGVHYRDLSVYVGMHDRLDTSHTVYHVASGVKHPAFTSNAVRDINDIAVLTLNRRLVFGESVQPICLPDKDMDWMGMALTVAGWGKTRQGAATSSRYLLETKVYLIDTEVCRKSAIYKQNLVVDTMMCAYNLGKDACQGDSGGPLFAPHPSTNNKKWYQLGVYTIVSKYISWIQQQTKEGMYCTK